MIDEAKEELAALYACDQLYDEELKAFEADLAKDAALRRLVDELRAATAEMVYETKVLDEPSPDLRERLISSLTGRPRRRKVSPKKVVAFLFQPRVAWGVAATFAVFVATFQLRFQAARSETSMVEAELASTAGEVRALEQQLEAERILGAQQLADLRRAADIANVKIARLTLLAGNSPEAVALAVWNPLNQEGMLTVEKLPLLQRDQDYQLWVIDPQYPNPVNGGVFTVEDDGSARVRFRPDQPVAAATKFAISRERKGGVPKAEGPIVAAGAL